MRTALGVSVFLILLGGANTSPGQVIVRDVEDSAATEPSVLWAPYAFYSETFDLSVGIGGIISGLWQEQMTIYGTAFHTKNDSTRVWMGAYDIRVPGTDRLFLSPEIFYTHYSEVRAYISGNPAFPFQQSGSNDSHPENFVTGEADNTNARLLFRYVLPIGLGKKQIVNRYITDGGILKETKQEKHGWNPIKHGRSYFIFEPFYADQRIEFDTGERTLRSNGLRLELRHDNTDFTLNPTRGSKQQFVISRDFGSFKSDNPWTHWEFDYRKYISLGETLFARQQVLAFNFVVSDTPTWKTTTTEDEAILIQNRPPYYDGSSLGGWDRMRAYPDNRFNDRSAVYYGIEYRMIPQWNPLSDLSFAGIPRIDWWQWVLFAEAGRVAGDFDLSNLHNDLHTDVGFGLRVYSEGIVARLDFAFASEGWAVLAMVGHPF